jgi:hypothetical protein
VERVAGYRYSVASLHQENFKPDKQEYAKMIGNDSQKLYVGFLSIFLFFLMRVVMNNFRLNTMST